VHRLAQSLPSRTVVALAVLLSSAGTARVAHADTKTCIGISEEGQRQRADHKLIAAKDLFDSCSLDSCPKIVRDDCVGWAKEVEAELPTVVFVVRDKSGKDVPRASVLVDGSSSHIVDGTSVPLDPGSHALKVTAGERTQQQTLNVLAGEKNRRVAFTLEDAVVKPVTPPAKDTTTAPKEKEGIPLAPVLVGSVSLVLVTVGVIFQVMAVDEDNKSKSFLAGASPEVTANPSCNGPTPDPGKCPYAYQVRQHHDAASRDQTIGIPMISVGAGALIVSGVFLYVLWPKDQPVVQKKAWTVMPSVGVGRDGSSNLGVLGTF